MEVLGGQVSGSLGLLSDAGHLFSDLLSLLFSLGAMALALRLPTKERTSGHHRAEIFTSFVNPLRLIAVSAGIV